MRGGDSSGLRAYNERLIVSAIRAAGPLSKAEIARATGLSAQAASVIVNGLLAEKVLAKRDKVRGQVGQPHTPIALDPEGAFSVGVKIGRRSVEAAAIDFLGRVVAERRTPYPAPLRRVAAPAAIAAAQEVLAALGPSRRRRVAGLGLAIPGDLHAWAGELDLPAGALDDWGGFDAAAALRAATGLDATAHNDATAACAAEMALGSAIRTRSALYLYLGAFVGGGVVIDGRLHRGERGNAGALGSMPVGGDDARGRPRQLIHEASLVFLERRLVEAGVDAGAAIAGAGADPRAEAVFTLWRDGAAAALARAVASAASVIDIETAVIDGVMNRAWASAVTDATEAAFRRLNLAGLSPVAFATGTVGAPARVLGAALMPLESRFSPQPELLARASLGARAEAGAAQG